MSTAAPPIATDDQLDELRRRVRSTRRAVLPGDGGSGRGVRSDLLDALLARWADGFDWRTHEARIQAQPWVSVGAGDRELRMIHQRRRTSGAPVVLLLHGWPDSVLRFERVLPLLTDVDVVVPALPGFPFAPPLTATGMSIARMAELVATAMAGLGYDRYTISGGDIGGDVAELVAAAHPDRVASLHLTNVSARHATAVDPAVLPPAAAAHLGDAFAWFRAEGGYIAEQSTRPNTLAIGLGDSPAGLAAWIVEKLIGWSDTTAGVDAVFPLDDLLTWVTVYWLTGTIGSSFQTYVEPARPADRVDVPTVLSAFAHDIKPAPREFAEAFVDLRAFVEHADGGHFAVWEQPEAYAADLRKAVALGR